MTAARMSGRHVGRDGARHGSPGRQPSPRGRSRSLAVVVAAAPLSTGAGGGNSAQQKAVHVDDGCKDWGLLSSVCRSVGEVFYGAVSNVPHAVEYAGWIWDDDCWGGGPGTHPGL
ncbi:hypothetical protein [Streptomyces sp. NPDC059894]|uniref:hypothetical protein n=1 Tax=unclassified Streptomyces TaxID=2593676 RepID=UPI00365622DD